MTDRRTCLLDAAIELLGIQGMRGLTHRAVDVGAGVPTGTTSNYFRTKDALLTALVGRFAEREAAGWDRLAAGTSPATGAELVDALAAYARAAVGPQRHLTLARYVILVESARRPAIQGELRETGARVDAQLAQWLRVAGSPRPEQHSRLVSGCIDGLVLHELAHPSADFDPTLDIAALLESLLKGRAS